MIAQRSFVWDKHLQVIASSEFWKSNLWTIAGYYDKGSFLFNGRNFYQQRGGRWDTQSATDFVPLRLLLRKCHDPSQHPGVSKKESKDILQTTHIQKIKTSQMLNCFLTTAISLNTPAYTLVTAAPATNAAGAGLGGGAMDVLAAVLAPASRGASDLADLRCTWRLASERSVEF